MRLSGSYVTVGTSLTADMGGFKSGETITLSWWNGTRQVTIKTVTASATGVALVSFKIGAGTYGKHEVKAVGSRGSSAKTSLNILRRVTASPSRGLAGTSVRVSVTGFAPGVTVEIGFYQGTTERVHRTVTTSAAGSASVTFTVPANASIGYHSIEASEHTSGNNASTSFDVRAP